jgi:hypothetical protein
MSQLAALSFSAFESKFSPPTDQVPALPAAAAAAPAAASAGLTASTNLCSQELSVTLGQGTISQVFDLFRPNSMQMYPHLRVIDLACVADTVCKEDSISDIMLLSKQHLRKLCSCCPAVQSLSFALCDYVSLISLQPLVQLSALTRLFVARQHWMH